MESPRIKGSPYSGVSSDTASTANGGLIRSPQIKSSDSTVTSQTAVTADDGIIASRPMGDGSVPPLQHSQTLPSGNSLTPDEFLSISGRRPTAKINAQEEAARTKLAKALGEKSLSPNAQLKLVRDNSPYHSRAELAEVMQRRDVDGNSIFHHAVLKNDYIALNKLLEHDAAHNHASDPNLLGVTPYMLAKDLKKNSLAERLERFSSREPSDAERPAAAAAASEASQGGRRAWWKFWKKR